MNQIPSWAWLAAGVILLITLADYLPRWAGALLIIIVLGYFAVQGRRGLVG